MRCVKKAISFDGVNMVYRPRVIQKAPKDLRMACGQPIPKSRMDEVKENIITKIWGV